MLSVDKNPLYVNKHINGKRFGVDVASGKKHYNYDTKRYHFIHSSGKEELTTQHIMVEKYNLNQSSVSQLVNGKLKSTGEWFLYIKDLERKEMIEFISNQLQWRVGINSPTYKNNKNVFINSNGDVLHETNYIMKNKHGCNSIEQVCKGQRKQSNGWFLFDDKLSICENVKQIKKYLKKSKQKNIDNKKYAWINKKNDLEEYLTSLELCVKYDLDRSHITKLKKGKLKQVKGWEIKNDRD